MNGYPTSVDIIRDVVVEAQNTEKKVAYLDSDLPKEVMFSEEIKDASKKLANIQDIFTSNLDTVVSCIYSSRSEIEIVWESPDVYIIVDRENLIKQGLEAKIEFSDDILDMHSRTAHSYLKSYTNIQIEDGQPWVILKPNYWNQAEWTLDSFFSNLITDGLSPTKALDYWMVEIRGKHLPYWADVRGKSAQAIRGNVNRAQDLLEEHSEGDYYDPKSYFESTYHGKKINDTTNRVTVDGGYLPPRRDIACHSMSGKYSWGYRGAGPTQLAFAILRHALDIDEITHNMVTSFRDHLNSEIDDSDEWYYSQNDVIEWAEQFDYSDT